MSGAGDSWERLAAAAAANGLIARGGFHPQAGETPPVLADGRPAATVVLVGNAGDRLWPHFSRSPEARDGAPHPLDRWCRRVIDGLAVGFDAESRYPNDGPPYPPFVAWAKRAEPVTESPIGILVHPDYGLWHAYRGALLFARRLALPPPDRRPPPCDTCADQPCRSACPVGAFTPAGYDVGACTGFLAGPDGADCSGGCQARRACPVGQQYNYPRPQQALHLDAFLVAQGHGPRFGDDP